MGESKTFYMSKEKTKALTDAVIEYNKKNNPIKIYNECFDYYVETYNIKPVYCENWTNVIDIRQDFEYRRIEKSINRMMSNNKVDQNRDFNEVRDLRRQEVDYYICSVRQFDPTKGKLTIIECPLIIWESIEKIAKNYVENYRFYGYVYKDDLVMSSIEKCLKYLGNFSPVSSDNAFSYFTTIIRHSFLENIKKEYNYSNIKQLLNTKLYGSTNEEQCEMQEDYL